MTPLRCDARCERRRSSGVREAAKKIPPLRSMYYFLKRIVQTWRALSSGNARFLTRDPPGHYYSAIPDYRVITARKDLLFDTSCTSIPAVNLNIEGQERLLRQFRAYRDDVPFLAEGGSRRFRADNPYFGVGDAVILYCFMRHLRPARVIEIGSGFSSALMLDVDESHFARSTQFTFIEPSPERLLVALDETDRRRCRLIQEPVQDVALETFHDLGENDILFIDSSHVAKIGSDVSHIISHVLPALRRGVHVHIHDITWPFEYPCNWLRYGRAWNEVYFVRAFLQYNEAFEVLCANSLLARHHRDLVRECLPQMLTPSPSALTPSNSSLWLRKRV